MVTVLRGRGGGGRHFELLVFADLQRAGVGACRKDNCQQRPADNGARHGRGSQRRADLRPPAAGQTTRSDAGPPRGSGRATKSAARTCRQGPWLNDGADRAHPPRAPRCWSATTSSLLLQGHRTASASQSASHAGLRPTLGLGSLARVRVASNFPGSDAGDRGDRFAATDFIAGCLRANRRPVWSNQQVAMNCALAFRVT